MAGGEGDDDGVVAGEHQVDHHDRGEGGPEFGGGEHAADSVGTAAERKMTLCDATYCESQWIRVLLFLL